MKATKVTLTVIIEVLSVDSIPSILYDVARQIETEHTEGSFYHEDGDSAEWGIEKKNVEL